MKVVINTCYGGFGLSKDAAQAYCRGEISRMLDDSYEFRADPKLVEIVEAMGASASASLANLKVVEIPEGVDWTIEDYDGVEWVVEKHRKWS